MYRSTETTDQRAGGEGDDPTEPSTPSFSSIVNQFKPESVASPLLSLPVSISVSILLFGLHPLVVTDAGAWSITQGPPRVAAAEMFFWVFLQCLQASRVQQPNSC